ncbi:Stk1 family PASTA domain-containing Ser/Thr kinase [Paenibacillus sp. 1011MAR3C5]|uniref:Stk1 family PASTA domain-containing Ser/Thr kinase n=1 Tax=Paenibacillus sp. 1011MAR3C5 TaxID=1675787 RepID=UPI000E6C0F5B|nr:Stk1 family PASTA domain-containing Ser/Thr kinase [Paenibacillus sp. 1011MAR3C5]RJE90553.1 Stk1 family PASTA domain-containing Ser/Thr kinase [Paenibacillus sp. 1011MAR3C5]
MIGHDLGGRYEILTRIGGGGMALVYKAHDVLLNRNVAVKVLRQQFVNDEEFIRRFRREAQSAAALSHPNVVSIYDVGQEEDTHYIVMEYVEGSNLNEIIQERAPLQAEEAVRVAVQICDALDHAHQNHIIHRDIKPHNILIGNNGRVKVTDFGIARAVTSTTITQTGSVVGSVHYFSPEHAKGINTGEKSDLYSLGIVLYQMLTGKLPFLGESPISVALKHLQETFEDPREVNPHIPQSVENVILKAMRKNPSERYNSAHEMLLDLDTCLRPDRLNEPKATFSHFSDMEETRVMPAIRGGELSVTNHSYNDRKEPKPSATDTSVNWQEEGERKGKGWKKPLIVVGVTLALLALIIIGFMWVLDKFDTEEVEVPYVVGDTLEVARVKLQEKGLRVEDPVSREPSRDVPKDEVMEQSKRAMRVKAGTSIALTVSDGPELSTLRNYVGQSIKIVKEELNALGVTDDRIRIKEQNSEEAADTILEQTPANGEQFDPEKAEISFTVSIGPETVEMIDLIDYKLSAARQWLKSMELVLNEDDISYIPSYIHAKDHIISVDNADPSDKIPKGTSIRLTVSSGIPSDSKSGSYNVTISPASLDKPSEIRIDYSDARGDVKGETRSINGTVTIPVSLVLSPDTVATVTVYRDGHFVDAVNINYNQLEGSPGLNIPGATPPPVETNNPEEPANAEVDEFNGESEGEH